MSKVKVLNILSVVIILLTIVTTSVGLFWNDGGDSFYMQSIHGENIEMFGNGIYAHESYFKAPIHKGTDAILLFIEVPLLLIIILLNRKNSLRLKLLHLGLLSCFLYYSASMAFGAAYNKLFLVYIILFSICLHSFILRIKTINKAEIKGKLLPGLPHRAISIFLIIAGVGVVLVWLMEIINSLISNAPLATLDIYSTEPTFVLDIGIIGPSAFIGGILVLKRKTLGYLIACILLTLNAAVGFIVISQSIFQRIYGVVISTQEVIVYVGVFVAMSVFAIVLNIRLLKNINH